MTPVDMRLSTAFDTVDHDILLRFLTEVIGSNCKIQNWFQSYLTGHTRQVFVDNVVSDLIEILYGVPQGSVHGQIVYYYKLAIFSVIDDMVNWTVYKTLIEPLCHCFISNVGLCEKLIYQALRQCSSTCMYAKKTVLEYSTACNSQ